MGGENPMKTFSIRLAPKERIEVTHIADSVGVSVAAVIRMCVTGHLPDLHLQFRPQINKAKRKTS